MKEISNEDDCVDEPKRTIKDRAAVEIFNNALAWEGIKIVGQRDLNWDAYGRKSSRLKKKNSKKKDNRVF